MPFVLALWGQVATQAVVGNCIFTRTKAKPSVATMLPGMPEFNTIALENLGLRKGTMAPAQTWLRLH